MIISDNKTIQQVQDEFSEKFPFLKLEFYKLPHEESGYSNVRKSGNIWLQTGITDYLTLAEQNHRGEESLTMV